MEQLSYPTEIQSYLDHIHAPEKRQYRFSGSCPEDVEAWQKQARPVLRELIGLNRIEQEADGFRSEPVIENEEKCSGFTRFRGKFETEPEVHLPFWMFKPPGQGPFPLAIVSHGHEKDGHDVLAGMVPEGHPKKEIDGVSQDIGVQAVQRGYFTIMPTTRGLGSYGVPDVFQAYGGRNCRSHLRNALVVGRTCIGERVWDVSRFIDWAEKQSEIDTRKTLMIGNSGGGVLSIYGGACDTRIQRIVCNSAFTLFVQPTGQLNHCDCNTVPGILRFGEFYDVAGLMAPRHLFTIRGSMDKPERLPDSRKASRNLARIYRTANASTHLESQIGEGGHRYYPEFFWPWVEETIAKT